MLREMTSSALAHSFKRFAQWVVVGFALAGLAACGGGGGGSSTPAETTPTTPTPDPDPTPPPDPAPTPAPTPSNPPEIPITPPPGSTQACFLSSDVVRTATCLPDTDCSGSEAEAFRRAVVETSDYLDSVRQISSREVQQCPRSSREYTMIAECRSSGTPLIVDSITFPLITSFWYLEPGGEDLEDERMACEAGGWSWHVHQQPPGVAVKPEYQDGVRVSVGGGETTYISDDPLDEFFIVPSGSEVSYALELLYRDVGQYGERWRITAERRVSLEVPSSAWESVDLPVTIEGVVIARDQHGTEARMRFFVTFEGPDLCPAGYTHSLSLIGDMPGCYCVSDSDPDVRMRARCS